MTAHDASLRLGVVTVNYRSEAVLEGFLDSISEATSDEAAIVIADNLPSDRVARLAHERGAGYLPLATNPGYGAAVNAAVRELPATVEWVLVSNPDVILGSGAIDTLRTAGETDARIGSIGPAVRDVNGSIYPSARRIPSLGTGIGHALFANVWPSNPWSRSYRAEASPSRRDAGWLSGACLLVRREAFSDIGGFDPHYFMYFEDVDLGYRLGRHGWRNVYEPDASITHNGAHSTATDSAAMLRAHHRSAARFLSAKYPGLINAPIRLMMRTGLRIRALILQARLRQPRG